MAICDTCRKPFVGDYMTQRGGICGDCRWAVLWEEGRPERKRLARIAYERRRNYRTVLALLDDVEKFNEVLCNTGIIDAREAYILLRRVPLTKQWTLKRVGQDLGIGQNRVREIYYAAIKKAGRHMRKQK